eukprot:scaffold192262_cov14-Tisochrysis_lutea.AAC.1
MNCWSSSLVDAAQSCGTLVEPAYAWCSLEVFLEELCKDADSLGGLRCDLRLAASRAMKCCA